MNNLSELKILCLIPARGGSKSIPRKNVIQLLGRPLIAWSIQHAIDSKYINRVIVSTDDDEIANVSLEYGAEVPFRRPCEIATDASPDIESFDHALNWLSVNEDYFPDLVVHLRPTGPSRRVEVVDRAVELMLEDREADSLRSISIARESPFKMWLINEDYMSPVVTIDGLKDSHSVGRQMLPTAYWQNGYVDIVRPSTIQDKRSMVGDKVIPFLIKEEVLDLDYVDDIPKIEARLKKLLAGEDVPLVQSERLPV